MMDFPILIDSMSLEIVLILTNSAGPDEMQHYAAFHLGLHYLPQYPLKGVQLTKGLSFSF